MASPIGTMSVVVEGKNYFFSLNRRQMLGLAEQVMGALKKMEPGK